jgi:hypothetical protein
VRIALELGLDEVAHRRNDAPLILAELKIHDASSTGAARTIGAELAGSLPAAPLRNRSGRSTIEGTRSMPCISEDRTRITSCLLVSMLRQQRIHDFRRIAEIRSLELRECCCKV